MRGVQSTRYDRPADAANYSHEVSVVLDYLRTGIYDAALPVELYNTASRLRQALLEAYCTDATIEEAMEFIRNCNASLSRSHRYKMPDSCTVPLGSSLQLDPFSLYLLSLRKLPSSENLHGLQRRHYLALSIIVRIIGLPAPACKAYASLLTQVKSLYHDFELICECEIAPESVPEAVKSEMAAFLKDATALTEEKVFHLRMESAVKVIYDQYNPKLAALNSIDAAKYISELDMFLDYFFHSSTPAEISIQGQAELDSQHYLTCVWETILKLRT